jgi:hypothetical protein
VWGIDVLGQLLSDYEVALNWDVTISPDNAARYALALLAIAARVEHLVVTRRPVRVVAALDAGASFAQVHTATGMTVGAVRAEIRAWVAEQDRFHLIDPTERDRVLALITGEPS